jgi:hypothetical protein
MHQRPSRAHLGSVNAGFASRISSSSHPLASIQLGNWGRPRDASTRLERSESFANGLSGLLKAKNRLDEADARIWARSAYSR